MQVNITLDGSEGPNELTAIMALCASLGGRLPEVAQHPVFQGVMVDGQLVTRGTVKTRPVEDGVMVVGDLDGDEAPAADPDERDVNGLPWDDRIHASSRTKNADGSWRQRRGVDAETVKRITESLKLGEEARNVSDPTPSAPPAPSNGPAPDALTASETPAAPAAEVPPPPPVTAAPPPPTSDNPFAAFQALTKRVGAAGLVYADLNPIAKAIGLSGYAEIAKNQDRIPEFILMAEAMGKLPA